MFLLTKNKMNKMISQTADENRSNEVPINTSVQCIGWSFRTISIQDVVLEIISYFIFLQTASDAFKD